ncbi:MAG: hypothetical protein ACOC85_02090 [Thermoplasmatota archaeon]
MDEKERRKLEQWMDKEVIPKVNYIGAHLRKNFTPEKAERLLPALMQLSITPQFYFEKESRRRREELLSRLRRKLDSKENKKKFTTFVHVEDIPYKPGAKPMDVAESLSLNLIERALDYIEEH